MNICRSSSDSSSSSSSSLAGATNAVGASCNNSGGNGFLTPASSQLTSTASGLSVNSWKLRIAFSSSSFSPSVFAPLPPSSPWTTRCNRASSIWSASFCLAGRGFFSVILEALDAIGDDFEVGEQQFLAERLQFLDEIAAAVAVEHDHQAAGIAHDAEPARIVAALRGQHAGRVQKFERGGRQSSSG